MKRAEKHLLEALYGHISSLGKFEADTLLEEDPDIMQRRAATRKVSLELNSPAHNCPAPKHSACPCVNPRSVLTSVCAGWLAKGLLLFLF